MYAVRSKRADAREDEHGFTLRELLTTIAILGILIAIAVTIFLALLEHWGVNALNKQRPPALPRWQRQPTYGLASTPRQTDPYGPGGPRPQVSGQVNGRTRTLVRQVALGNRMR